MGKAASSADNSKKITQIFFFLKTATRQYATEALHTYFSFCHEKYPKNATQEGRFNKVSHFYCFVTDVLKSNFPCLNK